MTTRHLLAVPCGAGPSADIGVLISIAQRAGWTVSVTATPSAIGFLDVTAIGAATGAEPRTSFEASAGRDRTRTVRKADAVIIAPATYNSVNKLACGIADNYALTVVAELVGLGVPTVVVPYVNAALARRAPYQSAISVLSAEGIRILGPGDQWEPHEPGAGGQRQDQFPWQQAFDMAAALTERTGERHL